jgi:serine protease Do
VRGYLGVGIESIDKKWQEAYDLKAPEGALVTSVEAGKPAEKAGPKREDVITKVDDVAVKNNRDLIEYVSGKGPGTKVTIAYLRDGREKAAVATLEERQGPASARRGRKTTRRPEASRSASRATTSRPSRGGSPWSWGAVI